MHFCKSVSFQPLSVNRETARWCGTCSLVTGPVATQPTPRKAPVHSTFLITVSSVREILHPNPVSGSRFCSQAVPEVPSLAIGRSARSLSYGAQLGIDMTTSASELVAQHEHTEPEK
eukprot:1529685-Amphidinium_carterae.1